MSSSRLHRMLPAVGRQTGFSVIELLLGLTLAAALVGSVGGFLVTQQKACVTQTDQTLVLMQMSVAEARLEKELRLAGAGGCPFSLDGPILEASPSQVVFLGRSAEGSAFGLVEWQLVGRTLMRRRGVCPSERPAGYPNALFNDNKTMLEGVAPGSRFSYVVRGQVVEDPVPLPDLPLIEAVVLELRAAPSGEDRVVERTVRARVAR